MHVRRAGIISLILDFLHPEDAKAATLSGDILKLRRPSRSMKILIQEIQSTELVPGWFWSNIRICVSSGKETVLSWLPRRRAKRFYKVLESARVRWWQGTLAEHSESLNSVFNRLKYHYIDPPRYLNHSIFSELERDARNVADQFPSPLSHKIPGVDGIRVLEDIQKVLINPEGYRAQANKTFVANELVRSKAFFDEIESKPLTGEQRRAVVVDENRNLVVAAAGSGKTSVIVAKAGWLVKKKYRHPSELLLLAFAKDAQKEMEERVRKRLSNEEGAQITVRTFHSLGMDIIGKAEGKRPTLSKAATDEVELINLLKDIITKLIATDPKFSKTMIRWFQEFFAPYRSVHDFQTQGEYWNYIRTHEIRSLQGDVVKSFEECAIANFLYLNGVPYEYEEAYEYDTATPEKRQYQPDFFLSDARIYIEHFALSESGDTPPFINREKYLESRDWKRQLHAEHGTILVETFSYENVGGRLTERLADKLAARGVTFSPIPRENIFSVLQEKGRIDPFSRLVATFLHHYKGAHLSAEYIAEKAEGASDCRRAKAFVSVFQPIFERYQDKLNEEREIDFDDMISKATEHVESGRYRSPFRYILVDEFQDISPGRARLLTSLLDAYDTAQLFAVGDDWQAIFRFAGSDITIMREFHDRFGKSERINLETTFRCADRIADLATKFILKNRAQIPKNVNSEHHEDEPCVHVYYIEKDSPDPLRQVLETISTDAAKLGKRPDVLLLGRYRKTEPENMVELNREHPDLELSHMTVHRSKGLEADYVVVLGLRSGNYGFPTEFTDDPVLNLVLSTPEAYPNAEERRLFYVAITRAKRGVYLLADGESPSSFVEELRKDKYDVLISGRSSDNEAACPKCVEGYLKQKKSTKDHSIFYGCSYWPYCDHKQSPCPECKIGLLVKDDDNYLCRNCNYIFQGCPDCDGWLLRKKGRAKRRFLGCSNFPACRHSENFTRSRSPKRKRTP